MSDDEAQKVLFLLPFPFPFPFPLYLLLPELDQPPLARTTFFLLLRRTKCGLLPSPDPSGRRPASLARSMAMVMKWGRRSFLLSEIANGVLEREIERGQFHNSGKQRDGEQNIFILLKHEQKTFHCLSTYLPKRTLMKSASESARAPLHQIFQSPL